MLRIHQPRQLLPSRLGSSATRARADRNPESTAYCTGCRASAVLLPVLCHDPLSLPLPSPTANRVNGWQLVVSLGRDPGRLDEQDGDTGRESTLGRNSSVKDEATGGRRAAQTHLARRQCGAAVDHVQNDTCAAIYMSCACIIA